jgi:hypothetical protein
MYYTVKSIAILIAVAAAGYSSYHIVELGLSYELGLFAFVMPLFIDGLAIIATLARGNDRFPEVAQRAAVKVLAGAGAVSIGANLLAGHNVGQKLAGVVAVGAYVVAEWFVSKMAHKEAVAMMAVADADAQLATAMATAANDLANAVATAVAEAEQAVRATMAQEQADLLAEAERATREAAARDAAIRADRERAAREQALADQLAKAEADRIALAEQVAKAEATKTPAAKPAVVTTPRVATGQAAATVAAILATDADMATDDVVIAAATQGVDLSARTVRRVRLEMRMATAAA